MVEEEEGRCRDVEARRVLFEHHKPNENVREEEKYHRQSVSINRGQM